MHDDDADTFELDAENLARPRAERRIVAVAPDRVDRCDRREPVQHRLGAHVARMEDVLDPGERRHDLRPEKPVGVGNQPDAHAARSDRLELLERLPAARAVAKRPAGSRAEEVLELRVGRPAPRAAKRAALELEQRRRLGRARGGGAKPAARSFSRPAALMRSVDHESSRTTSTSGSAPSPRIALSICARMTSSAGQPRNVGVKSTCTRSPSIRTSRTTPRSTIEMTGISGSGISARASQTSASATGLLLAGRSPARSAGAERRPGHLRVQLGELPSCMPRGTGSRRAAPGRALPPPGGRAPGAARRRARRAPGPLLVEGLVEPSRPFRGGRQPVDPHLGVDPVVDLLAVHLRRDARELASSEPFSASSRTASAVS